MNFLLLRKDFPEFDTHLDLPAPNLLCNKVDGLVPYWGRLWPSAQALSHYLLAQSQILSQKKVIEIGAGLGLPGVVASRFAAQISLTDLNETAVELLKHNISSLQLKNANAFVLNWKSLPTKMNYDILLLSDLNYQPQDFEALWAMVFHFIEKGTQIILSTPQRLLAKPFIIRLLPFVIDQKEFFIDNFWISVYMLSGHQKISVKIDPY